MKEVRVVTGAWNIKKRSSNRRHRIVSVTRAAYNPDTLERDIALLWIEEEMRTASDESKSLAECVEVCYGYFYSRFESL